jgi:D-serine deaminase-like pyridoxal phosphate-dependent protein
MSVSRSRSSQQSQSQLDPAFRDRFLANVTRATGVAEQLGNRQFAGQTGAMTDAMGTVRQLTQLAPEQVRAGSFLNKNIQDYMNPYQQAVIDTTLSDIERSRQIAGQQDAAAAIRARAFGGSRQGVAQAETNARALEQAARSAANLRAQGFEAATGLMGQELSLEQQANLANQQAALNAAQQRAAAATQLYGMGSAEQQLAQSRLDAERNLELERQQIINQALGLNVGGGSGAQSQSSGSSSSGGISFLG